MLFLQAIHTVFTLISPLINYIFRHEKERIIDFKPYFYFVGVALMILLIYALDDVRSRTRSEK